MKRTLTVVACFALFLFATESAWAQAYGTAGCGLGSIVFGAKPGIVQIFAATTNGTFANQTFGITSGTSNCQSTAAGRASAAAFIETNREAIAKDISRGGGETITNLSAVAGCKNPQAVGTTLQKEFKTIFPNEQVSDKRVSQSILNTLKDNRSLQCSHAS